MDSVIAKLDSSVFGMLVEQAPHILITGARIEDADFLNEIRPDFVCPDWDCKSAKDGDRQSMKDEALQKALVPVIRILNSPDELPAISGVHEATVLTAYPGEATDLTSDPGEASDTLIEKIRHERPDVIRIDLISHDESEYDNVRKTIKALRSIHQEFVD